MAQTTRNMAPDCKKRRTNSCTSADCTQLSSIVAVMNNLRKQGELCDVTLVAKGRHFSAHRVVLAAASEFFRLMFTTEMMESVSHEVELREAEPDIVELLIDFIYTTRISVNKSNVQSLLHAANLYQVLPVKTVCVEFLKGQLDVTNCLGISALAEFVHCPELKAKADDFVHRHFTEVSKLGEFLQLDVGQLTHLLRQDQLGVGEERIYEAARRWLMHDLPTRRRLVLEVFSCVRFPLLSRTFLSTTVQADPLLQDDPQCLKMLINGMCCHLLDRMDHQDLQIRPRLKRTCRIAVCAPLFSSYFNPEDFSWTTIRCFWVKQQNVAAVYWNGAVYVLGGLCSSTPGLHMHRYNIQKNCWSSKAGPPTPRNSPAACVTQGKIYASGGSAEDLSGLDVFESYDIKTESWQVETSMPVARRCHGSVEANGLVYVCGGTVGCLPTGRILSSLDVYNPNTRQWTELCAMKQARRNHGLVVVGDRIYAVGGQGPQGKLTSVEYYDIGSNEWHDAAPLPWLGVTVKCAAVDDIIYVLAGKQEGTKRLRHVLEYNTRSDRWLICSKVAAFPVTNCVVCVVDA